jgi:glycine/D-amino acid oxidase-like deaminating enzyme
MEKQQHFLIVGAGVAGLCIGKQLLDLNHRVTIIDNDQNVSTNVAAGMINPIVFRRMTKSWRVDEFLPFAKKFYQQFGEIIGKKIYHEITIRRLFSSQQERDFWIEKENLPAFSDYLAPLSEVDLNYNKALNEFGSGRVKNAAYISAIPFVEGAKNWLKSLNSYLEQSFDYNALNPTTGSYKGIVYDGVIFCEGVAIKNNPWFNWIPINPTKGEILTIQTDNLPEDESLNRKCFVLPIGNNTFRIGSTYAWNTYNTFPSEEGKEEICSNYKFISREPFSIIAHNAGIRPTILDRRPVMGAHEKHSNLFVFNGLGAKGYLLAPFLAAEFVAHLLKGSPIDKELRADRFLDKKP